MSKNTQSSSTGSLPVPMISFLYRSSSSVIFDELAFPLLGEATTSASGNFSNDAPSTDELGEVDIEVV